MKNKILTIVGLFFLLAAGYWGGALLNSAHQQVTGKLTFSAEQLPSQSMLAGDFVIRWNAENGGQLSIWNMTLLDKPTWQSIPGQAFIGAASGIETVTESRGMFEIRDSLTDICSTQEIQSIQQLSLVEVAVIGTLSCNSGNQAQYQLLLHTSDAESYRLEFQINIEPPYNRTFFTYASHESERFFGFGEQFTYFDLKGHRVPIWVSEQGVGRGEQPITLGADLTNDGAGGDAYTTYAPIPFYITSQMRSLLLYNADYSVFDLTDPQSVQISTFSDSLTGSFFSGSTPEQILAQYTFITGRMQALPDWVHHGAIVGMQGGTAKVEQVYQQLKALDTPIAAFWLQDWVGQRTTSFGKQLWWNWEVDHDHYPGWDQMVADFKADDIRVMVYVNPYLADLEGVKTNMRRNLFQEAKEQGYLILNPAGEPYMVLNTDFYYGMVDLSNPVAANWYLEVLLEQVVGSGASGWMADFGESLPYDAVLTRPNPLSVPELHNLWPVGWAGLNRAVANEAGQDIVFFMRAGFTTSPVYTSLFWAGDQMVSWSKHDGIKSAVTALNSSGLSGMTLNHSDIGGYTTITHPIKDYHRSKELLLRWMELNTFTTVFRTHEGNQPDNNVQFYSDDETLQAFSYWAKVFTALFDYRKAVIEQAAQTGLPVVRHPFIHYPNDPEVWKISYQQFMFGPDFMIAPVVDEGTVEVTLYLPEGNWVHLWTQQTFTGSQYITIEAPLGQPAVFYSEDSPWGKVLHENLKNQNLLP